MTYRLSGAARLLRAPRRPPSAARCLSPRPSCQPPSGCGRDLDSPRLRHRLPQGRAHAAPRCAPPGPACPCPVVAAAHLRPRRPASPRLASSRLRASLPPRATCGGAERSVTQRAPRPLRTAERVAGRRARGGGKPRRSRSRPRRPLVAPLGLAPAGGRDPPGCAADPRAEPGQGGPRGAAESPLLPKGLGGEVRGRGCGGSRCGVTRGAAVFCHGN